MYSYILVVLFCIFHFVSSIPINNGVTGPPIVECGSDHLRVSFQTQQNFFGRVYVKGYSDQIQTCSVRGDTLTPEITVLFDQCGLKRERRISPPGLSISGVIIISFHPVFLTKVDRAYKIDCFYMESSKTVTQELSVSMLTTSAITRQIEMPVCRYEVLSVDQNGAPVRFARIGDQVYHRWSCAADTQDVFCMRVHSCTVSDGQGGGLVTVIDEVGCALDRYILQNLVYTSDLTAGQEAHVFKFADRTQLNFNCQIELTLKSTTTGCRTAQPQCPASPGLRAINRVQKRETSEAEFDFESVNFDLPETTLMVLDLPNDGSSPAENFTEESQLFGYLSTSTGANLEENNSVCFTSSGLAVLLSVFVISIVACLTGIGAILLRRNQLMTSSAASKGQQDWKD